MRNTFGAVWLFALGDVAVWMGLASRDGEGANLAPAIWLVLATGLIAMGVWLLRRG